MPTSTEFRILNFDTWGAKYFKPMLKCDHKSVGVLVHRNGKLLLIERGRPPYGIAPPAGHVDNHGTFEAAAIAELYEEVGLTALTLSLVAEGRRNNKCRRPGGSWHYWQIYRAEVQGVVQPSHSEVKRFLWSDKNALQKMAQKTRSYNAQKLSETDWRLSPGLEPVWLDWFVQIGEIAT